MQGTYFNGDTCWSLSASMLSDVVGDWMGGMYSHDGGTLLKSSATDYAEKCVHLKGYYFNPLSLSTDVNQV